MAAPFTHLVLAQRYLAQYPSNFIISEFLIGTSFPDIRYLGVIDRSQTHKDSLHIDDVHHASTSFAAGMYLHALVDHLRSQAFGESKIFEHCPDTKIGVRALKLIEDEYLYNQLQNTTAITEAFEAVLPEELVFGIATQDIIRWHSILQRYLTEGHQISGQRNFMESISLPLKMIQEIEATAINLKANTEIQTIIKTVYEDFSFEIKQAP
jgi:hypothetical protein